MYPRREESDPLTKFFNDMRSEKSYLNRSIRDYSGSADDFESWKRNTIEVLKYTTLDPLAQVGSVVAKLTGEATMLNVDNVRNPDELFELIARSFHRSASRILSSDCKQKAGESIRTFGMRLRRCLAVCKLLNPDSLLHFLLVGYTP